MAEISPKVKKRIFDIIQIGNKQDLPSRAFDIFIVVVIVSNIVAMFLQTFEELQPYYGLLRSIEFVTVSIFCIEYVLRIWTAQYLFPGRSRVGAVWGFLHSFDGIVDLLTILPVFFLSGFVVFRMLRVVRIFHLFRINVTYDSFNVIRSVFHERRNQLASSVFIILILMLASSLCMYSAEHAAQPDVFRNGFSGIWWSMSTLLTIGYGDIYPVTPLGRFMAIIIGFLGVGVVAIPTGIISAGFVEQYQKAQNASSMDITFQTVIVDIDSNWIGMSKDELYEKQGIVVVMVRRGSVTMQPNDAYRVQMKDALAVYRERLPIA